MFFLRQCFSEETSTFFPSLRPYTHGDSLSTKSYFCRKPPPTANRTTQTRTHTHAYTKITKNTKLVGSFLFYYERKYIRLVGSGTTPSLLLRIFWISQTVLALKNLESIVLRVVRDDRKTEFVFIFQCILCFPVSILGLRALLMSPGTRGSPPRGHKPT